MGGGSAPGLGGGDLQDSLGRRPLKWSEVLQICSQGKGMGGWVGWPGVAALGSISSREASCLGPGCLLLQVC